MERSLPRLAQAGAVAAELAIQFGVFYIPIPGRTLHLWPAAYACIVFVKHVAAPLLGRTEAFRLAAPITRQLAQGGVPILPCLAAAAYFAAVLAATIRSRSWPAFWLFAAGLGLTSLSWLGALGDKLAYVDPFYGSRYAFAPQALFGLGLTALAMDRRHRRADGDLDARRGRRVVFPPAECCRPRPGLADRGRQVEG